MPEEHVRAISQEHLFDALVTAVPELAEVRDERLADHGELFGHVLMGDVVRWCEDHVDDRRADVARIAAVVAEALDHGDDRTADIALVSFSEGIFPGHAALGRGPRGAAGHLVGPHRLIDIGRRRGHRRLSVTRCGGTGPRPRRTRR